MARFDKTGLETRLIHAGRPAQPLQGAVVTPIFQSSTYLCDPKAGYDHNRYIRLSNTPSHDVLHARLAAIEGAEAAVATASGMSAITSALLTVLRAGDHVLAQDNLYGGTHGFFTHNLERFGIAYTFVDADDPASWARACRPTTKAFYVEAVTNPLTRVGDLGAVVRFAKERDLVSIIDNTFATPVNFRPIEFGFDLALHSATKFLNGHNDLVAGVVAGSARLVENVRLHMNHLGPSLDPHACFLLERGLKTLAVRMRYQNESALRIARSLENHRSVSRVNYPGLESHPNHRRARELFAGFGGVMSFELKDGQAAERLLQRVTIPLAAWSLGGVDSLITQPATTTHASLTDEARRKLGISDGLVRLSVGLETTDDLIHDLDQALRS